jgi:hypothetical protein
MQHKGPCFLLCAESMLVHAMQWQALGLQAAIIAIVALFFYMLRPGKRATYLVDFYCLRPPNRSGPSSAEEYVCVWNLHAWMHSGLDALSRGASPCLDRLQVC